MRAAGSPCPIGCPQSSPPLISIAAMCRRLSNAFTQTFTRPIGLCSLRRSSPASWPAAVRVPRGRSPLRGRRMHRPGTTPCANSCAAFWIRTGVIPRVHLRVRRWPRVAGSGPGGLVATLLDPQGRSVHLLQCHRFSLCGHWYSPPPPYSNSKGARCLSDVGREGGTAGTAPTSFGEQPPLNATNRRYMHVDVASLCACGREIFAKRCSAGQYGTKAASYRPVSSPGPAEFVMAGGIGH